MQLVRQGIDAIGRRRKSEIRIRRQQNEKIPLAGDKSTPRTKDFGSGVVTNNKIKREPRSLTHLDQLELAIQRQCFRVVGERNSTRHQGVAQ